MDLLSEILLLPLAPARTVAWVGRKVYDQAEQQRADAELLRARLADIEEAHRLGDLSDEQRAELEEEIHDELRWVSGERR